MSINERPGRFLPSRPQISAQQAISSSAPADSRHLLLHVNKDARQAVRVAAPIPLLVGMARNLAGDFHILLLADIREGSPDDLPAVQTAAIAKQVCAEAPIEQRPFGF